jgi:hypothetical protein
MYNLDILVQCDPDHPVQGFERLFAQFVLFSTTYLTLFRLTFSDVQPERLALGRYPKSRMFPFLPPSRHRSADNAHLLLYTFLAGLGYPSGSSCAVLFSCLPVCFRANLASFAGFCYGPIRAHQQSKRRAARSNEDLDAETGAGKAAKRNKSRSKRDKLASTFRRKKSSKRDNEMENIELRPLSSGRHNQSQPPHRHSHIGNSRHKIDKIYVEGK